MYGIVSEEMFNVELEKRKSSNTYLMNLDDELNRAIRAIMEGGKPVQEDSDARETPDKVLKIQLDDEKLYEGKDLYL